MFDYETNTTRESVQPASDYRGQKESITDIRLAMRANGYRPLPVTNIHMDVKSPGKQPIMKRWREICAIADEDEIRSWLVTEPKCTNTGLMTGISGGIIAVDIDILTPDVAAEIVDLSCEWLAETQLRRIGKAPKTLSLYRVAEAFPKIETPTFIMPDGTKAQIEVLAEGQQFVADGIHPETRRGYRWTGPSPRDFPVGDLPLVDHTSVKAFIEYAAEVLRKRGGVLQVAEGEGKSKAAIPHPKGPAKPGIAQSGDNFFWNVNAAALANPEPWVVALFGGSARYQPGTGAYRIQSKDLNRSLEEDISIHPDGIKDWGLGKSETPIDLVKDHGGAADAKQAAHWLCEKLRIDPVSLGWSEFKPKESPPTTGTARAPEVEEIIIRDEFTQPFDLFGDPDLTGVPVMPHGCVPDVIEAFARDEGDRIGIDPAMIAAGSIVACAAVIDDEWRVQPKRHDHTWTESPRVWLANIAPPSAKKTPALNAVINPLRKIDRAYAEADEALHEQYDVDTKIHAKKMDAYTAAKAKGENVPQPLPPIRPPVRRLVVNDVNIPKLGEVLADNPAGVICVNDELASWYATLTNKETGAKDRADWLSAYNGGPHVVDRIKRGTVRIPNWSVCLIGTIQPDKLRELSARSSDDGLMQRFMLIHAQPAGRGVDRAPVPNVIENYHATISTLKGMLPATREAPIRLSEAAQAERTCLLDIIDVIGCLPDTPEPLKYHLGKWDGLFNRLCLIYHMIEAAAVGPDPYPGPEISGDTASRVLKFMRELLLPNMMKYYREMFSVSPNLELARWISGYIIAHAKEKVTQRDIYRSYSSNLRDKPHLINDAMRLLDLANWVDPVESRNGRDVTEWKVNPAVHTVFAERAALEKKRRDDVKATIAKAAKLGIKTKAS